MQALEQDAANYQYLTFKLGDERYGIDVLKVREILDLVEVTKVPRAPEFMLGVINLRGNVAPVVDLRKRFGIACRERTLESCIIVLEIQYGQEAVTVGILGDSVEEVIELFDEQIEAPPTLGESLNVEFIQGMGKLGEQFIILLDIDKIFSDDELIAVSGHDEVDES